jgi:hypothetical protein
LRDALADRLVVAVKPLLGAVGVEPRGRVICGVFVRSTGSLFFREELGGQAEAVRLCMRARILMARMTRAR